MFIVKKVKEITEASASVGLLLATAVHRQDFRDSQYESQLEFSCRASSTGYGNLFL